MSKEISMERSPIVQHYLNRQELSVGEFASILHKLYAEERVQDIRWRQTFNENLGD